MIFVAILLVLVFNTADGLLGDGDTGYHIKTGEVILINRQGAPSRYLFLHHSDFEMDRP